MQPKIDLPLCMDDPIWDSMLEKLQQLRTDGRKVASYQIEPDKIQIELWSPHITELIVKQKADAPKIFSDDSVTSPPVLTLSDETCQKIANDLAVRLCESTDAVETPESTVSVPKAKYVFTFESMTIPTLTMRTHDIKNVTVSRNLIDDTVTMTRTDETPHESWEMAKVEQKDWLCCYELCVGGKTFYLHEIMGGFTPDEAAGKMRSRVEGDGWSLQPKGVLGEATLPQFLHHLRSTVTAEIYDSSIGTPVCTTKDAGEQNDPNSAGSLPTLQGR